MIPRAGKIQWVGAVRIQHPSNNPDKAVESGVSCVPRSVLVQRALGLVVAVFLALGAFYALGRPDTVRPRAGSTPSAIPAPSVSTVTSPAPLATTLAGAVATSGPGLSEPGIHVVAQPGADGSLEVVEHIKAPAAVSSLTITAPRASGSGVAQTSPTIQGFQAQADGLVVTDAPQPTIPAGGDRLDLPGPATDIVLRYRLEGAVGRSQPAPVGRVLVVLPPITAPDAGLGDLSVVVEVVGGNVRNVVCPDLPVSDQLCGRQNGEVWSTAAMPLGGSSIVAQIDLPAPGER